MLSPLLKNQKNRECSNPVRHFATPGDFKRMSSKVRSHVEDRLLSIALGHPVDLPCVLAYDFVRLTEVAQIYGEPAMPQIVEQIMLLLPQLAALTLEDALAALQRDPAASSLHEVLLCYPGVRTLLTHRLAHQLTRRGARLLARMWSEDAHAAFGIDIHPGCEIGRRCFIDHGTGVVIGETARIGNDVTIYQGVTLGALRVPRAEDPDFHSPTQRHPTVEDGVTLYAHSTILGGDTIVGRGSVIGCGAYVTHSVRAGSTFT